MPHAVVAHLRRQAASSEEEGDAGHVAPDAEPAQPLPDIRFECATWRWKNLDEGYNFGLDLVMIELCSRELWPFKVPGV
jgi:hypothetical protein